MARNQSSPKAIVIYNPHAGKKRQMLPMQSAVTLEEIEGFLQQYQIPAKFKPTQYVGHATEIAKKAVKNKVKLVIAAGGDGTIGEVVNGLIGSDVTLAILPIGSFMNVARMLSIPNDIEKAVEIIKIGRTRKIDVGSITCLDGKDLETPYYFLEESGIGLEAEVHHYLTDIFERGHYRNIFSLPKILWGFYGNKAKIYLDDKLYETRATLISISNGPITATALHWAPESKLNDHKFTISLYEMTKLEITRYLIKLALKGYAYSPNITTYQAKSIRVEVKRKRLVHADARVFGATPVKYEIVPNALSIITGFPSTPISLNKRTPLDP